jgi:hypothetical protein
VIAGRNDPATAWRTDVAWGALTRINPLGNLGPDEGRTYLTKCGVPAEHHGEALGFTRGHPLALSLIADVLTRGERLAPSRLDSEPEIVRRLLETFVQDVPSRGIVSRCTCMTAWVTTEPLLAAVLIGPTRTTCSNGSEAVVRRARALRAVPARSRAGRGLQGFPLAGPGRGGT